MCILKTHSLKGLGNPFEVASAVWVQVKQLYAPP